MSNSNKRKKAVLFLCTGNSARSQMAEVLLRHKAGSQFDVFSAGTHPEFIDNRTLIALEQFGLPVSLVVDKVLNTDLNLNLKSKSLTSKNITEFSGTIFDYVITLCDNATLECRDYSGAKKQLAWDFPDPKKMKGLNPFSVTLHALDKRLSMFLLIEAKLRGSVNNSSIAKVDTSFELKRQAELSIKIEPSIFYKCLTDDIRLKALMLTNYHGELCVCELMQALDEESQPKVSRNLAVLKKAQIITDRKHGQWVFYRLNSSLPLWVKEVISQTTENNIELIEKDNERLSNMRNRPDRSSFCH